MILNLRDAPKCSSQRKVHSDTILIQKQKEYNEEFNLIFKTARKKKMQFLKVSWRLGQEKEKQGECFLKQDFIV